MLVLAILIITIINIIKRTNADSEFGLTYSYSVDNQWKNKDGDSVDLTKLSEVPKNSDGTISIFTLLSSKEVDRINLIYRSVDCSTKLYSGSELLYETNRVDTPLYDKPIGSRWNLIRIEKKNLQKRIEIRIKPAYKTVKPRIDNTYLGDRGKLLLDVIYNNIINVLFCFIIFIVSVMLAIYSILTTITAKTIKGEKDYGLGYLAIFAFLAATWCLFETNTVQIFSKDLSLIEFVSKMMVLIANVPLMFFIDSCYGVLKNLVVRVIIILDMIYIAVAVAFQVFGIYDLAEIIGGAFVVYGAIVVILLIVIIGQVKINRNQKDYKFYYVLQQLGFLVLALSIMGDMARMIFGYTDDKAVIARPGIVVFLTCIVVGNVHRMIQVIQYGMKSEFVGHLAYSDGLTEVGNRTAYEEKLKALENRKDGKFGVIIFDVNNLKIVNDNFGHEMGDKLIKYASVLIKSTFGKIGKVYRIGGDEFAVIIFNSNPLENYNIYLNDFNEQMKEFHMKNEDELPIVVAHGFSWCSELTEDEINQTIKRADEIMYENKKKLKLLYPTYLKDFRKLRI